MITINNIYKIYVNKHNGNKTYALKNVSASFADKGLCFITGRSGSGKTTLLNIISTIDSPTRGDVVFNEFNYSKLKKEDFETMRNHHIGIIFQEYYLIPYYTVGENIKIAIDLLRDDLSDYEKIEEVNNVLRKVSLVDKDGNTYYDRKISELSGGEKQRVAIARALIKKPKVILADEPTGALDLTTGKEILTLLKDISKEYLVIVVSHDEEFANNYGDRIIKLSDGQIVSDTGCSNIQEETIDENFLNVNKVDLKFKTYYKMGIEGFKHKSFRLVLTIIMLLITTFSFGAFVILLTSSTTKASLKYAYCNNGYTYIKGYELIYYEYGMDSYFSRVYSEHGIGSDPLYDKNSVKTQMIKDYGGAPIIYRDDIKYKKTINLTDEQIEALIYEERNYDFIYKYFVSYYAYAYQYVDGLPLEVDSRFIDKSLCHIPNTIYEIALTDVMAELYFAFGFVNEDGTVSTINTPDDLIGKKVGNYTICGVYTTPDSQFIFDNRTISIPEYEPLSTTTVLSESFTYCMYSKWILCNDFYGKLKEANPDKKIYERVTRFFLPAKKGIISDSIFLAKLFFIEENSFGGLDYYGVEAGTMYYKAPFVERNLRIVMFLVALVILVVIFFVLSILALASYLNVLVNRRKKEFGILLSIGFKSKNLKKIILIEAGLLCLIILGVFYITSLIIIKIINDIIFVIPFLCLGFIPIVLTLLSTVLFTFCATNRANKKLSKLLPKEILIKSDELV